MGRGFVLSTHHTFAQGCLDMFSGTEHTLSLWGTAFAGCGSSVISSSIPKIVGMEGTENLNYKATKETYFHVFYGNHIPVHALLKNTSLGTMFAGAERTGQLL